MTSSKVKKNKISAGVSDANFVKMTLNNIPGVISKGTSVKMTKIVSGRHKRLDNMLRNES